MKMSFERAGELSTVADAGFVYIGVSLQYTYLLNEGGNINSLNNLML